MELEDQKKIETCLEIIILTESDLIREKYVKIRQDEQSERRKNDLEKTIKRQYHDIAHVKTQAILRQKGLKWSPADDSLCDEESEKEFQRWKNFTPEEKIREYREQIGRLQGQSELENDEDWEPMTDIAVDRWIEEENEKH